MSLVAPRGLDEHAGICYTTDTSDGKEEMARVKKIYTPEEKQAWKEERLSEQKQLIEDAVSSLTASDAWESFVKFGRANLGRLTLNNALMIWSQKRDASVVWGKKQWEKKKVAVNTDAKPLRYFAPGGFYLVKDAQGNPVLDKNGNEQKRMFFRVVTGYDVSDTDAPKSDFNPMVELEGDEMMENLPGLEMFARRLGYTVDYREDTGKAHGWVDDRMWKIVVNKNLSGNALVRTLTHELAHAYGNVNYKDYSREEAEVIVESATVMALSLVGYDVTEASVPYIASWSNGDLKALHKYVKLVDELAKELARRMEGKEED